MHAPLLLAVAPTTMICHSVLSPSTQPQGVASSTSSENGKQVSGGDWRQYLGYGFGAISTAVVGVTGLKNRGLRKENKGLLTEK